MGIGAESIRSTLTGVAAEPETDALGVDVGTALQIFSCGDNILIFRCAAAGSADCFAEGAAVANAAAVVECEDDVAAAGEVLVHGIRIRVVVHVMPPEQHLANRSAMKKNQSRTLFTRLPSRRGKNLCVQFEAIRRFEDGLLRNYQSI